MDLDVEIMQVQEKIYCAEKEVTLLELELQRKVQCLVDLQRRELSLLERKQRPTPATEGLGGLLVTAVWAGDDLVDCAKSDVGEDGEVTVQTSTQDLGHETEVKFSQPLSDISDPRVKVSRVEAVELLRDKTMSTREAAEMLMRKVLKVGFVDLSSDDLQEVEDSVAKIGKRMLNLNRSVKKSHNVARPDDTFLSSSMYDDLRLKVQAKMTVAEEEDSGKDRTGEVLVGEGVREDKVGDEVEEAGLDGGLLSSGKQGGRGYYKAFTDLAHLSKDMKRRAVPLHACLSEWCELNRCSKLAALGYLLHSLFYNEDKALARLGVQLLTQGREAILVGEVPHLVALWLVERLRLGRGRYTDCRLLLLRF